MKKILIIFLISLLPQKLFGQNQRQLPDVFFIKCEGQISNLGVSWLVKIDRKK